MSIKEQESTSCALDLPIDDAEWALATRRQAAAEASHQCVGVLGTSSFMSRQILSHGSNNGKD